MNMRALPAHICSHRAPSAALGSSCLEAVLECASTGLHAQYHFWRIPTAGAAMHKLDQTSLHGIPAFLRENLPTFLEFLPWGTNVPRVFGRAIMVVLIKDVRSTIEEHPLAHVLIADWKNLNVGGHPLRTGVGRLDQGEGSPCSARRHELHEDRDEERRDYGQNSFEVFDFHGVLKEFTAKQTGSCTYVPIKQRPRATDRAGDP